MRLEGILLLATACHAASPPPPATAPRDAPAAPDAPDAPDPRDAAVPPPGFIEVEGCTVDQYVDVSAFAAPRVVTPWDTTLGRKCLRIAVGQTVTWSPAPNAMHVLEATQGTSPTPIVDQPTITFMGSGYFGFDCETHHELMHGGIWVQ